MAGLYDYQKGEMYSGKGKYFVVVPLRTGPVGNGSGPL